MARIHEGAALLRSIVNHPANRGHRFAAAARFGLWQAWKRALRRPRDLTLPQGYRMRAWPDSTVASQMIYFRGRPDWDETGFLLHYLKPGDGFVDVGAHIGTYSLLAATLVGAGGWVEAFEPSPDSAARFRTNMALNGFGWVRLYQAAVGECGGTVRITSGLYAVNRLALAGEAGTTEVPQVRLDDVLAGCRPAAAKLDIEGAEPMALAGWKISLEQGYPRAMLIEVNRGIRRFGLCERDLVVRLRSHAYRVGLYDCGQRHIEYCDEPWTRRENILAIHEPSLPEILARIRGAPTMP